MSRCKPLLHKLAFVFGFSNERNSYSRRLAPGSKAVSVAAARILIGINNENAESVVGCKLKDQRSRAAAARVLISADAQTKG